MAKVPRLPILFAVASATLPLFAEALPEATTSGLHLVTRIKQAELERGSEIQELVSTRRYVLRNKRWETDAVMNVLVVSGRNGTGKRYEILSMEHADGVKKRAFLKVLETETEASNHPGPGNDSGIHTANYDFVPLGLETIDGRQCVVLQISPKGNSKLLLNGKIWVDLHEEAIVKLEGRTARNVSFWIGKPQITQKFHKIDGMWLSAHNHSVSDVKFLGSTELTIEYLDYKITRQNRFAHAALATR